MDMASERVQRQIDRLLDGAETAITQRSWTLARDHAQAVLAIDPDNTDALTYITAAERALASSSPSPDSQLPSTPSTTPPASPAQPPSLASSKRLLAAANDRDFAAFGDERLRHGASYRHSSRRMPCELTKR